MNEVKVRIEYDDHPEQIIDSFIEALRKLRLRANIEYYDEQTYVDVLIKKEDI